MSTTDHMKTLIIQLHSLYTEFDTILNTLLSLDYSDFFDFETIDNIKKQLNEGFISTSQMLSNYDYGTSIGAVRSVETYFKLKDTFDKLKDCKDTYVDIIDKINKKV